jgi:hypothetical protein
VAVADRVKAPTARRLGYVPAILVLGALAVVLWLPFGWRTTGTIEEWLTLEDWFLGRPMVDPFASRPLHTALNWLAYTLTPYSFVGLNLLMMLAVWAKGAGLFLLLRRLDYGFGPALAAAALFIVNPADDAAMSLRLAAHHAALAALLIALWLLALRRPNPWQTAAACALLAVSLLIYEAAFPLALLAPLLLWRRAPRPVLAGWLLVSAALLLHYLWAISQPGSPQAVQVTPLHPADALLLRRAYFETLVLGWLRGVRVIEPSHALLALPLALALAWLLHRAYVGRERGSVRLLLVGLVALGAGFLMFLPSEVRYSTWRVYLYPSLGAAVVLSAFAYRYARAMAPALAALLVFAGLLGCLRQHAEYVALSQAQQGAITAAAQVLAANPGSEAVVMEDATGTLVPDVFPNSRRARVALQVIFDDPGIAFMVCYPDGNHATLFYEACEFTADEVILRYSEVYRATAPDRERRFARQFVATVRYEGPRQSASPLPSRAFGILPILPESHR